MTVKRFPANRLLTVLCALPLCTAIGCGGSDDKPQPDPDTCTAEQTAECEAQGKVCIGYTGSCEFAEKTVLKLAAADGATTFSDGAGKGLDISLTLNNPPSKLVTVQLSTEDAKAKITPSEISFHTDDWQRAQKVTIVGTDDDDVNDGSRKIILKAVSASEDAEFNNLSASLELTHLDALDETAECGYIETLSGGALEIAEGTKAWFEGESGTYCVSLKKQPTGNVDLVFNKTDVLSFTGDNSSEGNGHLVFTPENFNNQQCLSFKVADTDNAWNGGAKVAAKTRNNLPEEHALYRNDEIQVPLYYRGGDGITDGLFTAAATVTTEDECYSAEEVKASLRATILDQNGPALLLPTEFETALTEGDTEFKLYTVKLAGRPTDNVSVIATDSTDSIEFSSGGSTSSIALTPDKWDTGATFQLRAKNNDAVNSAAEVPVKFSVTSVNDEGYAALKNLTVAQETFQIADDDKCNINVRYNNIPCWNAKDTQSVYIKLTAKPDTTASTFDVNLRLSGDTANAVLSTQKVTFNLTDASAANYYTKEQKVTLDLTPVANWGDINKAVGSITVTASAEGLDDVTFSQDRMMIAAKTFTYKDSAQATSLPAGTYDIQAWGASSEASINNTTTAGSTSSSEYLMGWGAYASGRLTVATSDSAWIRVGGVANGATGGYNGGGNGGVSGGRGGGGASDVCMGNPIKCSTNNDEHYPYRILVAAGGGARHETLAGGNGCNDSSQADCIGASAVSWAAQNVYKLPEFFGKGMNAGWEGGSGGGGGWYGGMAASSDDPGDPLGAFFVENGNAGGSGGSSFCFTGVNATYTRDGGKLTDDTYKLSNCKTLAGGNWATENDANKYYVGDSAQSFLPQNTVYGRRGPGLVIIKPVYVK